MSPANWRKQGMIAHPRIWVLYARWKGLAAAVKAGEYEIQPGTTPRELLTKMVNGQVLLHSFTIVDGWRVAGSARGLAPQSRVIATLPAGKILRASRRGHGETGRSGHRS